MFAWFTQWRRYRKFWAFLIVGMVWAGVMAMDWKFPALTNWRCSISASSWPHWPASACLTTMLKLVFGWLTGSTLDRILASVDNKFDNETERARIRAEVVDRIHQVAGRAPVGSGWWFPLLFLAPARLLVCFRLHLQRPSGAPGAPSAAWSIADLPRPH
jgi:hypothetical protein